ncbi:MAG: glycosyltransferase family 4 protein, partial [Anaerolineales bacterium]|nr:glycosyltransferase family 4 protein [Anaerolineales bacterium]
KGSFDLLRAAKIVGAQRHQVVFRLVGQELTAGEMDALEAQAKSDGLESFVHIQPAVAGAEKIAALRSADIFVYPSYHEGMPMAVIEALACGLPVVATQVGGLPDLVFPQVNGLLVPAGQPDQLADALLQLIDSPQTRSAMQRESLRLAQENFDIEKLVARLLDIYQSALAPR